MLNLKKAIVIKTTTTTPEKGSPKGTKDPREDPEKDPTKRKSSAATVKKAVDPISCMRATIQWTATLSVASSRTVRSFTAS